MKQTSILISSLLIACLIGQTYQATCALTPTNIDAGADSNFQISLTALSGANPGYLRLTFGNGWGRESFPQFGLLCTATAGFAVVGQQSCEIVPQANSIQVNIYNTAASATAITVLLHHMRNPFGQADPVTCDLMPATGTTPQTTANAALTSIGDGIINILQFAQSSQRSGDIANVTFSFSSSARFQPGHKLRVVFPDYLQAFEGYKTSTQVSTSFLAGCDANADCTLEQFLGAGKIQFKSQTLVDQNVAVTRIVDSTNNNAETLVLTPNIQNFTQNGQPIEVNFPRAIKTPPTTFYPYDIQVIHTDASGNIIATTQKSYNPAFLIATQAAQLNATQQFGDTNTAPGTVAKYQFFVKSTLPLCKDCLIGVFHQGLTLTNPVTIATDANFAPTLTVQSQNSSVILLKSDDFYPKLDQGSFTIGGITNPQTKGNALKIVIFDGGMNAISATQQPLLLVPAAASGATGSCKIMAVDQSNAIGSTGRMRFEYKPVDTTNSTGTILLKFNSTQWPVSATMPKVMANLTQLQPGTPGFDPNFPGYAPNSTVTTKFPVPTTYQVEISNIQSSFQFVFELQNMVNPSAAVTSTSTVVGICQILDKSGALKDTTNMVVDQTNLWAPPQLNANFTPSMPLKNSQPFDANFTLALTQGVPASGYFQITLPDRNAIYNAAPNSAPAASYIAGCTNVASCAVPVIQLLSLATSTAAPVALTVTYPSTGVLKAVAGSTALVAGNYKLIIKQLVAPVSQAVKAEVGIVLYSSDNNIIATTNGAKDKPIIQSSNSSTFATGATVDFDTAASKNPSAASTYSFSLTTTNPIPVGGALIVNLPPTFVVDGTLVFTQVDSSTFYDEDLTGASASAPPQAQKVVKLGFTGFAPAGSQIQFKLSGLKNPTAKVNNYTIITQDAPQPPQNNQPAQPANILEQGLFAINPVVDASSNVCTLNSATPNYLGFLVGGNIFAPPNFATWTIQYNPKDVAVNAGIIQISLPVAKFQDVSNIVCNSQNGGFQQGPGSSCTITKNATYTTIKIVGAVPFFQYQITVVNITNPSVNIPMTTGTSSDNIGYCQLFEASTNKLIDTTPFSNPTFTFSFLPDGPIPNFGNPINGGLTTLTLNMVGAVGVFSTDKLYFEVPSRLENSGTVPTADQTGNSTFITSTSVISLIQYKVIAPTSPTAQPTQTLVATFPCVPTTTPPTSYDGTTIYSLKPTFPTGTTYLPPSPTTLYQLNITNVRLAPQSKAQNLVFKLLDSNNGVKVQKMTLPLMSSPAQFQAPGTKASISGTPGAPLAASQTYSFTLVTSNPIPATGTIEIDFPDYSQGPTIDTASVLTVTAPSTANLLTLAVDSAGTSATLTANSYIAAGTLITFTLNSITNGANSFGNKYKITSFATDGTSVIDTVELFINPTPTANQCVLQSVTGPSAQVVGQPANFGFTLYSTTAGTSGGKIVVSLSKKIFGVAPTSVTCSSLSGFTTTAPTCTLAYDSTNKLILTVSGTSATNSFDFTVKGMFNPTSPQLPGQLSDTSFGSCALYATATATTAVSSVASISVLPTWQPAYLQASATSSNPANGGIGDLSVTFMSMAPIITGTLIQVAIDQVNSEQPPTYPYISSIVGLTATNNTPGLTFKTPFSCSVGTTKYTPTQTPLMYNYNGPQPSSNYFGDYLNIGLVLTANIPAGSVCTFVLGRAIRNPTALKQGPGSPIQTQGTITLYDTSVTPQPAVYAYGGQFSITNQQPAFLNVTAQMIGSTIPGAFPVTYQFNVQQNNTIPTGGSLIITLPQGTQYTPGNVQKDDSKFDTPQFDQPTQSLKFPVLVDLIVDPSQPPQPPFIFIIDGFKNPQNLTGNVFNATTLDQALNLIDRGSFSLNPVVPQPGCVLSASSQPVAGQSSNYKIKLTLDKPINQTGASIAVTFSKAILPIFPDGTTSTITCIAVSPTFATNTLACQVSKNQTSGDGIVIIPGLNQDQNVFEFTVNGLTNPQSAQAIQNFGQCSAVSQNGQVIKSVPLTNNGVNFQPAPIATKALTNSNQNIGAITDAVLTLKSPLAIQNGTIIILSLQRRTVDYIGAGISASVDSSIVNCTAASCTPKVATTSLICTNTAQTDTIVVPYQNIKAVTAFIATQKYDNVTLIPSINTPIPADYSCSISLNGFLLNPAHEGNTNVLLTLNDAKGGIMAQDNFSYAATISGQGQLTGNLVAPTTTQTSNSYTFTFKASNPIPLGGRISLDYNSAQTPNVDPKVTSSTPTGIKFLTAGTSNGIGTVILNNTGSYIAAGQSITFVVSGFAYSNPVVYTGNTFSVHSFLAIDIDNDGDEDVVDIDGAQIQINPVGPITVVSQAFVTTGSIYTLTFKCPIDLNGGQYNISLTYPTTVTFAPTTTAPCSYTGGLTGATTSAACIWTSATKNVVFPGLQGNTQTTAASTNIVLNVNNFTPAATTGTATGTISVVQGPQTICSGTFPLNRS